MDRNRIRGLNAYEYQHPFDRSALVLLRKTKGLSVVIKKVSELGIETFTKLRLTGSGLRVTKSNFPTLYELYLEACEILDLDKIPEFYLLKGDTFTSTVGVENPLIALSSGMIDSFDEDELLFILGHQLSYIKSESVLYQQLASALNLMAMLGTKGPVSLITLPVNIAIKRWEKMAKYTADRAGLLCCQDTDAVMSTLIKLAGQPNSLYSEVDIDEFKRQAYEFDEFDLNRYNRIVKMLVAMDETHPPYVIRGAELFKWIKSGDYENIIKRKPLLNIDNREKCSFCGKPTLGDENFCTNCGNKIIHDNELICPKCKNKVEEDDKFCVKCGNQLLDDPFSDDDLV